MSALARYFMRCGTTLCGAPQRSPEDCPSTRLFMPSCTVNVRCFNLPSGTDGMLTPKRGNRGCHRSTRWSHCAGTPSLFSRRSQPW